MGDKNKNKDKSIIGVTRTSQTKHVERTGTVEALDSVKAINSVEATSKTNRTNKLDATQQNTQSFSQAERLELLNLIQQEADKMEKDGSLPQSTSKIAREAVLMAVDAAIILKDPEETK
jgi:hypothetical protein